MKTQKINRLICLFILMAGWIVAQGQNQWEVPGDHFSLEGALELFKKSNSPQEFEQLLNDADSKVNNLDLNGDGYIDYIRVIDMTEKNVHVFVIQAVISERQSQDVAVITLEKLANGKAVLQITGDEDIYGIETIIEPTQEVRTYGGTRSRRMEVNVWSWPSVQYIYSPYYSVWISPWGWSHRPVWWHTWSPVVYHDYYAYWSPYRHHYTPCYTHRVVYAHHIYRPYRTSSVIVHSRHNKHITHYRSTRIDTKGRYQGERSDSRQSRSAVRYDANGRINTRSSTYTRTQQRTMEGNRSSSRIRKNDSPSNRSASAIRSGSNSPVRRSSEVRKIETSGNRSGASNRSSVTPQRESSTNKIDRSVSSGSSNTQRYERGSSANPASKRSYSGYSGSTQRSSSSTNVQRSTGRSSGSSGVQRSSGSSGVQRSTGSSNIRQSTGSSKVQRSSGSSNVQRSSGSSKVQRSSGSSNVQRSSGSSNVQRSSGSSKVQKSSGSSGNQRSSGSSGGSNTQRSGGSSSKERGRH